MLKLFVNLVVRTSVIIGLLISVPVHADVTDILVYKGELRFVLPFGEAGDSLLIQHRSKTRDVLRIALDGITITNMDTYKYFRLPDRSVNLMNQVDEEGYWITDFLFNDLDIGDTSYRVEGTATLYLIGSQRSRRFNVYLRPESDWPPPHSTIDWGLSD